MEVIFKSGALLDLKHWEKSGNKLIQKKISELLKDIAKHPETGIGKPEKLKYDYLARGQDVFMESIELFMKLWKTKFTYYQ